MLWLCTWATLAGASPDLDVERGWEEMGLEHYPTARDHALEALEKEPDHLGARVLYRAASAETGLGHRVAAEFGPTDPVAPWRPSQERLRQAVAAGDAGIARAAARDLSRAYPEHPELLLPLWGERSDMVAIGARYARRWSRTRALEQTDRVGLHRLYRFVSAHPVEGSYLDQFLGQPAPALRVERELRERGEIVSPRMGSLPTAERTHLAHGLLDDPEPVPPPGPSSQRLDIAHELAALLEQTNRSADAAALYARLRPVIDDPTVPLGEARARRTLDPPQSALDAANEAIFAATGPARRDLGVRDESLRRSVLAEALVLRAAAWERVGEPRRALVDVGLSALLAGTLLDRPLSQRLSKTTNLMLAPVARRYPASGAGWQRALTAARAAADPAAARQHLEDAQFLAVVHTRGGGLVKDQPALYRGVLQELLLAEAELATDSPRAARAALVVATLWLDADGPEVWRARGEAHEACGDKEAAFEAYARAAKEGADGLGTPLARTYRGPGNAVDVVGPIAGFTAATEPGSWGMPAVGKPFPDLRFETQEGARQLGRLMGRYLLVTLYKDDCDACVERLPRLGALAQEWRDEGRDALAIGISLDATPANLQRVLKVGAPWGALVHGPELGPQLGVDAPPVSFLVDPEGVTRLVAPADLPTKELEKRLRAAAE